ncbi:Uma2 family endonuclease [Algoriphagus sp. PAP.12]|uniref:Uma2 family endonuclease n=1 Tax=Algoriphagus sp. PAP.12 TaxID=2996678 RepID=UPI002DD433C9|nr:Uma2 family endonuclease [Algoriphagus sp. PAP.12]
MVELIHGKIFKKAAAAPRRSHQIVSGALFYQIFKFLEGKKCHVYSAPFDVRFPKESKADKDVFNVVQPDISVICDLSKLDEMGCLGAPDLVVEILSPANSKTELRYKYSLYEEFGVNEYWIIHPIECTLLIYTLKDGRFQSSRPYSKGDEVQSQAVQGFELELDDIFKGLDA